MFCSDCDKRCLIVVIVVTLIVGLIVGWVIGGPSETDVPTPFSGRVWSTGDLNCTFDPGKDSPVAGAEVRVTDYNTGNPLGQTLTDQTGSYNLSLWLSAGDYNVIVMSAPETGAAFCDTDDSPPPATDTDWVTKDRVKINLAPEGTAQQADFAYSP